MATEKKSSHQTASPPPQFHIHPSSYTPSHQQVVEQPPTAFQMLDKQMIGLLAVVGISAGALFYLFREMKKLRYDLSLMKESDIDSASSSKQFEALVEKLQATDQKVDSIVRYLNEKEKRQTDAMTAEHVERVQKVQQQIKQQATEDLPSAKSEPPAKGPIVV